jgi:transcriptional regulator with XRE-family HTH domain
MGMSRPRKPVDDSTYAGRFALRLKTLREDAGLTVDQLAERSGIPAATIYDWEKARHAISIDQLPQLADALGISIRSLLPKK